MPEPAAKAKQVRVLGDADIRRVRLHLKATAHELIVVVADGSTQTFGIMNLAAGPKWEDARAAVRRALRDIDFADVLQALRAISHVVNGITPSGAPG